MTFDFVDLFILASLFQGLFISLALCTSRLFRSTANTYLAASLVVLTLLTYFGWLDPDELWLDFLSSIMWELLFPAMLTYYIFHSLQLADNLASWGSWLFLPFAVSLTVDTVLLLLILFAILDPMKLDDHPAYEVYDYLTYNLAFFYNLFTALWLLKVIGKVEDQAPRKVKWLRGLVIFVLCLLALWLINDQLEAFLEEDYFVTLWLTLSLLFWWICYYGVYQMRVIEQKEEIRELLKDQPTGKVSVSKAVSSSNRHLEKLAALMIEQQLFKEPDLSRLRIAELLELSEGHLSQLVNSKLGQSFVDYVNTFRIESAKQLLKDPRFDNYSLEAIGLEVGFQSKSAFYHTFKKIVGATPGAFKKSNTNAIS